jgi:hypothetical protein
MDTKQKEPKLITAIWAQRKLGIDLPNNMEDISPANIDYVCDNSFPFLQIINSDAVSYEEGTINFVTTSTGWTIHDYGEAISLSARQGGKPIEKKLTDTKQGPI